jgi:preprotein translocase subunit SecA
MPTATWRSPRGPVGTTDRTDDILLDTIDSKWLDHLYEMDYLKEAIGLSARLGSPCLRRCVKPPYRGGSV